MYKTYYTMSKEEKNLVNILMAGFVVTIIIGGTIGYFLGVKEGYSRGFDDAASRILNVG